MEIMKLLSIVFVSLIIWDLVGFIYMLVTIIKIAIRKNEETGDDVTDIFDDIGDEVGSIVGTTGDNLRNQGKHLSAGEWFVYMLRWPVAIRLLKEAYSNM